MEEEAERLAQQNDVALSEAKKAYQSACDRMGAQNDVRQSDEPAANTCATNPVFVGAKAYVAFIECVRVVGPEAFHGITRHVDELDSNALRQVTPVNLSDDRPKAKEAADITHNDAYTIQDAKLKLEADIRANSALAKKNRLDFHEIFDADGGGRIRGIIADMRDQFVKLKQLDARHEPAARLEEWQWNIDPEYVTMLMASGDKQCDEVRKEMAYAYEQSELLLTKMRNKYVGNLAVELITLHGFQNGLYVQSFRTTRMRDGLQERLCLLHQERQELAKTAKPRGEKQTVLDFIHKPKLASQREEARDDEQSRIQKKAPNNDMASDAKESSHRFDHRKQMRAERKMKIQAWEGKKPKEEADDPRDVAAIAFASTHMEDYKLKTSANYVVPEDQRARFSHSSAR
ncbi:Cilia- and flagella-associated protein 44 [Aphanomyces cochlioides]|nr:Cilia- and flagella-associated protein 44 [Aphanomyces cochlioides]